MPIEPVLQIYRCLSTSEGMPVNLVLEIKEIEFRNDAQIPEQWDHKGVRPIEIVVGIKRNIALSIEEKVPFVVHDIRRGLPERIERQRNDHVEIKKHSVLSAIAR